MSLESLDSAKKRLSMLQQKQAQSAAKKDMLLAKQQEIRTKCEELGVEPESLRQVVETEERAIAEVLSRIDALLKEAEQ